MTLEIKRARHRDNTAQHGQIALIIRDAFDHRTVQLQRMQRQDFQIAEVAETRAKII